MTEFTQEQIDEFTQAMIDGMVKVLASKEGYKIIKELSER